MVSLNKVNGNKLALSNVVTSRNRMSFLPNPIHDNYMYNHIFYSKSNKYQVCFIKTDYKRRIEKFQGR